MYDSVDVPAKWIAGMLQLTRSAYHGRNPRLLTKTFPKIPGLRFAGAFLRPYQGDNKTGQMWSRFFNLTQYSGHRNGSAQMPGRWAFPRLQRNSELMFYPP